MKVKIIYFENEGYVPWGYYLEVDGVRHTFPNPEDPRYPIEQVFSHRGDALEVFIKEYLNLPFDVEIEYYDTTEYQESA